MKEIKLLFKIVGYKKQIIYLLIFSVIISLIEFIGLALLVPYISIATDGIIPNNKYINYIVSFFNITDFSELIVCLSVLMILFYSTRFLFNIVYQYLYIRFINKVKHTVMIRIYNHYIRIPYREFVKNNSSDLKKLIYNEPQNIQIVMQSVFVIVSEFVILILLLSLLLYVDFILAGMIIIIFSLLFFIIKYFLSKKIENLSIYRLIFSQKMIQNLDEMLNNFKFIKLIGSENSMKNDFYNNSFGVYSIGSKYEILNQLPKLIIEVFGMMVIISIVLYLVVGGSSQTLISIIGVYAIAFYRALPSLHKIIISFNNIKYYKSVILIIYESLQTNHESYYMDNDLTFSHSIKINKIVFKYENTNQNFFDKIELVINKGDKVAFIGESGSGKSTLVDILMGILQIDRGAITVDDTKVDETNIISWRKKFGYNPQEIYLFDSTVANNIVFGRKYDEEKVIKVLKQAKIYDFLMKKDGLDTIVGEGGVQLSGGQKQRIGIARALYGDPEILVLDEATSALDDKTEAQIMNEIYNLSIDKTLIIIAHRLSTIKCCNVIYKLEKGIVSTV